MLKMFRRRLDFQLNLLVYLAKKIFGYIIVRPWIYISLSVSFLYLILILNFRPTRIEHTWKTYRRALSSQDERMFPIKEIKYVDLFKIIPKSTTQSGDFPVSNRSLPFIPHIIHQTHWDKNIPKHEEKYVTSVIKNHPKWQYYFWTDESARQLIRDRHPSFLSIFDSYTRGIKRGDALRYFVLYEYGGIYMDLDFLASRALDRVTYKYSCIMPAEPIEQGVFLFNKTLILSNAIMMCMPKHPFFKFMIETLHTYMPKQPVLKSTGPEFVTNAFYYYILMCSDIGNPMELIEEHDGYTFLPEKRLSGLGEPANDVHIPSTLFFNDALGELKDSGHYQSRCVRPERTKLDIIGCNEIVRRGIEMLRKKEGALSERIKVNYLFSDSSVNSKALNSATLFDDVCLERGTLDGSALKCDDIFVSGLHRSPSNYTFTEHQWFHSWIIARNDILRKSAGIPIEKIVPHAIIYN